LATILGFRLSSGRFFSLFALGPHLLASNSICLGNKDSLNREQKGRKEVVSIEKSKDRREAYMLLWIREIVVYGRKWRIDLPPVFLALGRTFTGLASLANWETGIRRSRRFPSDNLWWNYVLRLLDV
jgi:hypothetical protein